MPAGIFLGTGYTLQCLYRRLGIQNGLTPRPGDAKVFLGLIPCSFKLYCGINHHLTDLIFTHLGVLAS